MHFSTLGCVSTCANGDFKTNKQHIPCNIEKKQFFLKNQGSCVFLFNFCTPKPKNLVSIPTVGISKSPSDMWKHLSCYLLL